MESDEEYEHLPSEFYYPEERLDENSDEASVEASRTTESQEEIEGFLKEQKSANTLKKTTTDMNTVARYMKDIGKNEKVENLPAAELDHLLCKFFVNIRKKNGQEYEPDSISGFQRSIQRYLSEKGSNVNILKDKDFEKSRNVLAAKRKSLIHEQGKDSKPQAATALEDEEEDNLFEIGEFGDSNPVSLQRAVWWLLSLHFGFRARDESRKLRWGDVQLQQDKDGEEMLVWLAERGTKTRHGQEKGHQRAFQPKVYATKTERCPVKFYKTFKSHRPVEMNQPESPFYLAVRQNRSSQDQVWYMRSPLRKNEIGKFLSTAAQNAVLHREGKRVTNHSVRKTCISRLLDDIPENFVAQLTGHKSTESLQSYKSASSNHQRRMSLTLSRARSSSEKSTAVSNVEDLQMASCSSSQNASSIAAINSMMNSSVDPLLSSTAPVFAGANIGSISDCTFQIFHGNVKIVQAEKKRRLIIESDDDD